MRYISSRGNHSREYSASEAIREGMVPGGGLFVCEEFPQINIEEIGEMRDLSYPEIAVRILGEYLSDYTPEEIGECVYGAYNKDVFTHDEYTPIVSLAEDLHVLELWHGPTAAFKDMALQLMPRLFARAGEKTGDRERRLILVATSGDTGKAALEGFKDVQGVDLAVFYPAEGVSRVQELQMVTSEGDNVRVAAVEGNFDHCQSQVKRIFREDKGGKLSSANSINLGRLLPQIVYYFKGYLQLLREEKIALGEEVDFTVPTGNFGNILAGYYAGRMGLPIGRLVCASNKNNVLTDFLSSGSYNRRREFHRTMSPSMDILISSNLERFLFHILGRGDRLKEIYDSFEAEGILTIGEDERDAVRSIISAGYAREEECLDTIRETYEKYNYLMDTHTGVAMKVALENKGRNKMVVLSTASIYKFPESVMESLGRGRGDETDHLKDLEKISGQPVHRAVAGLEKREVTHRSRLKRGEMKEYVDGIIKKGAL